MENKINDNYIKEYFFTKLNKLYTKKFLDFEKTHFPKEIYEYLINRYNDSQSLKETVYRINFGYDVRPVCENCGKPIKFLGKPSRMWKTYCSNQCRYSLNRLNKYKQTCLEKYGVEYAQQSNKVKDKAKQTCLEKYGVEHYTNREKSKQTCLEKYGVESNLNIPEVKEKIKQTCLEKYGVEFFTQADVVKEKIKQTCLEKYGVPNGGGSKESLEKIKQTCLKRYGVEYSSQVPEVKIKIKNALSSKIVQDKINNTKRKNNTFNTSKPEENLYKEIKSIYPSVIRQYKESRYPYNCDFYIPELDMFIELQGSWTHGKHPYNEKSNQDQLILNKWKSRLLDNHGFYLTAIKVWTISDPKKRETAKKNNLNYVELFNKEDINLFLINLQNIKNEKLK